MTKSKEWEQLYKSGYLCIMESLLSPKTEKVCVLAFCKSGRHRSVASGDVFTSMFRREGLNVTLEHLSKGRFWQNTCGGKCAECKHDIDKKILEQLSARIIEQWDSFPQAKELMDAMKNKEKKPGQERSSQEDDKSQPRKRKVQLKEGPGAEEETDHDTVTGEEAIDELLSPFADENDVMKKILKMYMERVYNVFNPKSILQIEHLLDVYDGKYMTLLHSIHDKYLKDSPGSTVHMSKDIIDKIGADEKQTPRIKLHRHLPHLLRTRCSWQ